MIPHNENISLKWNNHDVSCTEMQGRSLIAFHEAAKNCNWYNKLLTQYECTPSMVNNINDFRNLVPILTKESVFEAIRSEDLVPNTPGTIQIIMLSSGHTGKFSMGVISRKEVEEMSEKTDAFLEYIFGIREGEAFVINASSMGVRTFTGHTCCDTGPRSDLVVELLRNISPFYEKTVVIADPYLVKQIVEESIDEGIDYSNRKIWFISGGEWLPESLRKYVHKLIGKCGERPEEGFWSAIFGVTELGYPLFFETSQMVVMRSRMAEDSCSLGLKYIDKMGRCSVPFLFEYFKSQLFLEQINGLDGIPELVFTLPDPGRIIPMIRYKTGDTGELINVINQYASASSFGQVLFWGRSNNWLVTGTEKVMINDIRELLFADDRLATNITGYFTLEQQRKKVLLSIQLKRKGRRTVGMKNLLQDRLNYFYPSGIEVSLNGYYHFKQQMGLDMERKFNHLK